MPFHLTTKWVLDNGEMTGNVTKAERATAPAAFNKRMFNVNEFFSVLQVNHDIGNIRKTVKVISSSFAESYVVYDI